MAMGKVMPSYGLTRQAEKATQPQAIEAPASVAVTPTLGGFAFPEMAMGKVIIRREAAAPEIVETKAEAPVKVVEAVETAPMFEESPIVVEPIVSESVVADNNEKAVVADEKPVVAEVVTTADTVAEPVAPVVVKTPKSTRVGTVAFNHKNHAASAMTKAPGSNDIKAIDIIAAPFKTDRYVPKGAGSQVARSQASAEMTKPQGY